MAGFLPTGAAGKAALLAGALLLAGQLAAPQASAQVEPRLNASALSCAALQQAIAESGAAIVRSRSPRSAMTLSDRFVSRRSFCFLEETLRSRAVITSDTDRCPLQRCVANDRTRPGP